jgi:hypothetical protein
MNTAENTRRKWVIIPVQVSGKGLYEIDFRMPANVDRCEGMMLSVKQQIADRDFRRLGELSLELNSRKVHPIHLMLDYLANSIAPKKEPLSLEESLQQSAHIGGFYRDYSDNNYTLNIYLACRTKPIMQ